MTTTDMIVDEAERLRARVRELEAARERIAAMPTRREYISGQGFNYIKVADVLDILDAALTPSEPRR